MAQISGRDDSAMFRFAICNELYREWPMARALAHIRDCGYQGIEIAPFTLGSGEERFSKRVSREWRIGAADHGLAIVGLHWLLAQTEGLHWASSGGTVRRRTSDYLARLTDLCAELGGQLMVLGSPQQRQLSPDVTALEGVTFAADVVGRVLPRLTDRQIVLAIEPLGPEETNFLNTADQAAELVERWDSPWIRLNLDVKAMTAEVCTIPAILARHRRKLAHFHANDPNRRGPGMGHVDFVPILKSLIDIDYQGWISVEVFDESPGIESLARESIGNLRRDYSKALALEGPNELPESRPGLV